MNVINSKDPIRLQVFLSRAGVCSRRKAMDVIKEGRVVVNGQIVREPSTPVSAGDAVSVDGKVLGEKRHEYILLNKPQGVVTTKADRFAEKTVMDLLPEDLQHLHPVGRLDKETEGLLILTNDGELTLRLTHPRYYIEKTYAVRVKGSLSPQEQRFLEGGIVIDGKKTAPSKISQTKSLGPVTEFLIVIHEGRKRQIRLMLAALGHPVAFLKRVSEGPITLGTLKTGSWRRLTQMEIQQIKFQITSTKFQANHKLQIPNPKRL